MIHVKLLIAAVALITAGIATPGPCQKAPAAAPTGGDPTPKACDTQVQAPHVITFAGKSAIEGEATSTCQATPIQHNVQIFLERKSAGQWSVQPDPRGVPAGNCLDLPSAGQPHTCRWIISRCTSGLWRTRVTVFGYGPPMKGYPGGKPFNFPVPEKPEAPLSCK